MGVQDQGQGHAGVLHALEQGLGLGGAHGTGHILQADGIEAHALQLLAHLGILGRGVDRGLGVGNAAGSHGVLVGVLLHHVIVIVLVAQQVLATQQHLQLGVGHGLAELPQTLPGILVQVPQAAVEGSAAPALHGVVTGLVHGGQDALHIGKGHTGGHQGLVGIPQDGFSKTDFLSHVVLTSTE